jgi:hypothetical protein
MFQKQKKGTKPIQFLPFIEIALNEQATKKPIAGLSIHHHRCQRSPQTSALTPGCAAGARL